MIINKKTKPDVKSGFFVFKNFGGTLEDSDVMKLCGSQVIKVYLDGKEITHSVEQHQRERGASIMGNEVYSY